MDPRFCRPQVLDSQRRVVNDVQVNVRSSQSGETANGRKEKKNAVQDYSVQLQYRFQRIAARKVPNATADEFATEFCSLAPQYI